MMEPTLLVGSNPKDPSDIKAKVRIGSCLISFLTLEAFSICGKIENAFCKHAGK